MDIGVGLIPSNELAGALSLFKCSEEVMGDHHSSSLGLVHH